jgi:ribosomal protein S18 acetylase RimI-like enzyme
MENSSPSVRLEEVSPDQAADVEAMACRIWPTAYRDIISREQIEFMLSWMYAPETIAREMAEENVRYFWIVAESEKVGFLAAGPFSEGDQTHLHKCYVLSEHHGRGFGSCALKILADRLRDLAVRELELRVNRNNLAAIKFYQKGGFDIVAEDKADIGGGYVMDDFIMRLIL